MKLHLYTRELWHLANFCWWLGMLACPEPYLVDVAYRVVVVTA